MEQYDRRGETELTLTDGKARWVLPVIFRIRDTVRYGAGVMPMEFNH